MMQVIGTDTYKTYGFDYAVDPQHPYPGLFAFREEDSDYFFGRQSEIDDLVELIKKNVLTVVFGKSGVGKTSLLRAGLIPGLRNSYYLPIYLRLNFGDAKKHPLAQAKEAIESKIKTLDPQADSFEDLTFWEYFYNVKILKGFVKPLLFFDQFEEIFTMGKNAPDSVNEFIIEIADLIEHRVPVSVQEKLKKKGQPMAYSDRGPNLRVIFSLREDYLPQLETLSRYIPSVRFSRYRVSQIKGQDAIDAVLKPGKEIITDPDVAVEIIKKIPGAKDVDYKPYENRSDSWENKKIEPFLLSLFCYQVNEKRLEAKAKEISGDLVKDVYTEDIINDYYKENISRFRPTVKTAIEDLLLTGDGYRKLEAVDSLKTGYGITHEEVEKLVDRRIIRKETRIDIEYIELIHDVLAPILKENRDKRKEEEKRRKELAERKKKYSRIIVSIIGMAAVFLVFLTLYAFKQKAIAEKREVEVQKAKKLVEKESRNIKAYELAARSANLLEKDPTLSFRLAENAYQTEKNNPDAYNALLGAYYSGGFYQAIFKHDVKVTGAWFFPDGEKYIVVTSDKDKKIRYWNFSGNEMDLTNAHNRKIHSEKKPPDQKNILTRADSEKVVSLPNRGGEGSRAFKGHTAAVNSAVVSPDGRHMVSAGDDHTARLWDIRIEDRSETFSRHTSKKADFFAAFSPGGSRVLTVSSDKAILWDLSGSKIKEAEPGNGLKLSGHAAFSPGGKHIVFLTNWDEKIGLWMPGAAEITIVELAVGVNSAAFSPDNEKILTGNRDNSARLWNLNGGLLVEFKGHEGEVNSAVFSPGGKYVLTASWDGTAGLWDPKGGKLETFKGHESGVNSAVFSGNGDSIVTASSDGTARVWDLKGNQHVIFEGHTGAVTFAGFSPDRRYIITGSDDRTARLWDLHGTQVFKYKEFDDIIRTASFSPGGKYILIAPSHGPAHMRLVNPEEISRSVNERHVWQLDDDTKKKYNLY